MYVVGAGIPLYSQLINILIVIWCEPFNTKSCAIAAIRGDQSQRRDGVYV